MLGCSSRVSAVNAFPGPQFPTAGTATQGNAWACLAWELDLLARVNRSDALLLAKADVMARTLTTLG